ncbi:MAG: hypothetical protein N4A63_09685 [Vallitalea sp.]|nr:hypothetical protein [Vallitalea sp.]MCT4597691.1 hypothetical protein [Vallitalea sp.]
MYENSLGFNHLEVETEWRLYVDEAFNIETIVVVLAYKASRIYKDKALSELTTEEWKKVVGAYNATSEDKQKKICG